MSTYLQIMENPRARKLWLAMPRLVNIALLALLGFTLAQLTWLIITPADKLPVISTQQTQTQPMTATVDHASQIAQLSLFGSATPTKVVDSKPKEAPETRLNLKLRGVFALDDEEKGLALIADGSGPEKMYMVNDTIGRGTTLASVYPDRVMLKIRGRFETLKLPETQATGMSYSAATQAMKQSSMPRSNKASSMQKNRMPGGNKSSNNRTSSSKSLKTYRREFLRDPQQVAKHIAIAPVDNGYRVSTKSPHPAIDKIGLQDGDIVTAVNGIPLDTQANGLSAFRAIRTAKQVTVNIIRQGQPTTLNVSF